MNWKRLVSITLLVLLGPAAAIGMAQPTCDTSFTGLTDNDWTKAGNWDVRKPTSSDVACIPAGKTAVIPYVYSGPPSEEEALAVYIQADATNGKGMIEVAGLNTLAVYADSWIDGTLKLDNGGGEFVVGANMTIKGDGGEIVVGEYQDIAEALYRPTIGGTSTLTLACDPGGNGSEDDCMVLKGSVEVKAPLVNNAYVVADNFDEYMEDGRVHFFGDLILSTSAKSGSGDWIVRRSDFGAEVGHMRVEIAVTGSGRWLLVDDAAAVLTFNADCNQLTGDMFLEKGTLEVNANIATSGDLTFGFESTAPTIKVAEGARATFGVGQ